MEISLYKLDKAVKDILEQGLSFDYETGEVLFTAEDLEKLETSIEAKINNIIGYIKNLELEQKMYKEVSDDYKTRAEEKKKKSEKLKNYLDSFMTSNNITKKEVMNGVASYRKSTVVDIYDESKLKEYIKLHKEVEEKYTTTKVEFSKKGMTEDLKKGIKISGVQLTEKRNLQVK